MLQITAPINDSSEAKGGGACSVLHTHIIFNEVELYTDRVRVQANLIQTDELQ